MQQPLVLIVDDDVLNHWLVTETLTAAGFVVVGRCRGAEALALLDLGCNFDVLLTELRLGDGMSGFELARRWNELHPGRPVIYTGLVQESWTAALRSHEGFVLKHAEAPDLLGVIGALLQPSPLRDPGREAATLH